MLTHSFCHLPGIGAQTERQLWASGLHGWDHVTPAAIRPFSPARRARLLEGAQESRAQLAAGNAAWFDQRLPARESWRMFSSFEHSVAFLDIETTGLDGARDHVTTIVLYDGQRVYSFVHGRNLEDFPACVARYDLLVTYNGKTFDLPFLRRSMGIPLQQAHIDLRYVLASLGYSGGLKGCERALGLERGDLADVDGFFAVLLWNDYRRRGDERTLQTLLAYNAADVLNLAAILPMAVNAKLRETPFAEALQLPELGPAHNPFEAHRPTIDRIARGRWG